MLGNELVLLTITWLARMTWYFLPYFSIPLLMACISPWKVLFYEVILYIERAIFYACNVTFLVKAESFQTSLLFRKEKLKVALSKSYFFHMNLKHRKTLGQTYAIHISGVIWHRSVSACEVSPDNQECYCWMWAVAWSWEIAWQRITWTEVKNTNVIVWKAEQ